jgi:hypothetical protein
LPELRKSIEEWKRRGEYFPLAQNRPFRLLCLHLTNFISLEELLQISESNQLTPPLRPDEVARMSEAVSILHFRAKSRKPAEEGNQKKRQYARKGILAAIAAARYQYALASRFESGTEHIQGYAKAWLARTLLLDRRTDEALQEFEEALAILTTNASLPERHDVLNDIAALVATSNPDRATACVSEAQAIRCELGVD